MRIALGSDHAGFSLKVRVKILLEELGHEVVDFGAHSLVPSDDYPDFVVPLARAVVAGKVDRGVAICGNGVGAEFELCRNMHQKHNADDNAHERSSNRQHRLVKSGETRIQQFRLTLSHGTPPLHFFNPRDALISLLRRRWLAPRQLQQEFWISEMGAQVAPQQS